MDGARIYEITIRGAASQLLQVEFDDVQLRIDGERTYLRTGWVDQTVLLGLIRRIENLGLVLLEVRTSQQQGPEMGTPKVSVGRFCSLCSCGEGVPVGVLSSLGERWMSRLAVGADRACPSG